MFLFVFSGSCQGTLLPVACIARLTKLEASWRPTDQTPRTGSTKRSSNTGTSCSTEYRSCLESLISSSTRCFLYFTYTLCCTLGSLEEEDIYTVILKLVFVLSLLKDGTESLFMIVTETKNLINFLYILSIIPHIVSNSEKPTVIHPFPHSCEIYQSIHNS